MFKILLFAIAFIVICVFLYIFFTRKQRLILIEKNTGLGGPDEDIEFVSIHFTKKIYDKIVPELIDRNHFFVPLRETTLFFGRTILKNYHPNGQFSYSCDGYEFLTPIEIEKGFKIEEACSVMEEHLLKKIKKGSHRRSLFLLL